MPHYIRAERNTVADYKMNVLAKNTSYNFSIN